MTQGIYTALQLNAMGPLMNNQGMRENKTTVEYLGTSPSVSSYTTGTLVETTVLKDLTAAIQLAWQDLQLSLIDASLYQQIITIGSTTIPALGNTPPTPTWSTSWTGSKTQFGFLALMAREAQAEFQSTAYLMSSISAFNGWRQWINQTLNTASNAEGFEAGVFSGATNAMTAGITGVNPATVSWGQDLINLGNVIDFTRIDSFGSPQNLLISLKQNYGMTESLNLSLGLQLSGNEIELLGSGAQQATAEQNKRIYAAFSVITGDDLDAILLPLNCQTQGLQYLTDLLDPVKMFPNSYKTLMVPVFGMSPDKPKTFVRIYSDSGAVNPNIPNYGTYLQNIIPADQAVGCGAFSISMQQITGIFNAQPAAFAETVAHMETAYGLTQTAPGNQAVFPSAIQAIQSNLGGGSGPNQTYTLADGFGLVSGVGYNKQYAQIQSGILSLNTAQLSVLYGELLELLVPTPVPPPDPDPGPTPTPSPDPAAIQAKIAEINAEIANIQAANQQAVTTLNGVWSDMAEQVQTELQVRERFLAEMMANFTPSPTDAMSWVMQLPDYAGDTSEGGSAQVIEGVCDLDTSGGQCIVAAMRESRNTQRLQPSGLQNSSTIPDTTGTTSQLNGLSVRRVTGAPRMGSMLEPPRLLPDNLNVHHVSAVLSKSSLTTDEVLKLPPF